MVSWDTRISGLSGYERFSQRTTCLGRPPLSEFLLHHLSQHRVLDQCRRFRTTSPPDSSPVARDEPDTGDGHRYRPAPGSPSKQPVPTGFRSNVASLPLPHPEKSPPVRSTTGAVLIVSSVGDGPRPKIRQKARMTPPTGPDHVQSTGTHHPPATRPQTSTTSASVNLGTTTTSDKRQHSHRQVLHPPPETTALMGGSHGRCPPGHSQSMGTIWWVPESPLRAMIWGSPKRRLSIDPTMSFVVEESMIPAAGDAAAILAALLTVRPRKSSAVRRTSPV